MPLGENSFKKKKLRLISHDKMTHLAKNCVTMNDLKGKFNKKLSQTMLYVNNVPS